MADLRVLSENASDKEVRELLRTIANRWKSNTFTWDPPSVPASSASITTLTSATVPVLTGLRVGMAIKLTPPATFPAGMIVDAFVATDNELSIILTNITIGAIDIGSTSWAFVGVVV
jgi:hypothetical protein